MALIQKLKLIPVEGKWVPVKKGSEIEKYKIKFVNKDMKFKIGYNEDDTFWTDKIKNITEWNDTDAIDTEWIISEWNGETKSKLNTGNPVMPDER